MLKQWTWNICKCQWCSRHPFLTFIQEWSRTEQFIICQLTKRGLLKLDMYKSQSTTSLDIHSIFSFTCLWKFIFYKSNLFSKWLFMTFFFQEWVTGMSEETEEFSIKCELCPGKKIDNIANHLRRHVKCSKCNRRSCTVGSDHCTSNKKYPNEKILKVFIWDKIQGKNNQTI